jgi:hypothetical protein
MHNGPLHELYVVDLRQGSLPDWVQQAGTGLLPLAGQCGARVLGVWTTVFGATPQVTALFEYPDLESFARSRLVLADPAQRPAAIDGCDALATRIENRLLVPSPYRAILPVPDTGIFTLRTFTIRSESLDRFHRTTVETVWNQTRAADAGHHIGLWTTAVGRVNEIVMLSQYRDLAHWDETHVFGADERQRPPVAWTQALQERARDIVNSAVVVLRRLPLGMAS